MPRTPLLALAQAWELKLALSTAGALLLEGLRQLAAMYGRLLEVDPLLVVLAASLLVVDAVTGIAAALRRGERLTSKAWRRTGWKALEYSALAFVGVAIANAFAGRPFHAVTDGFDDAVLLYIALTEGFSVIENVTGSRAGAVHLLRRITDLATGRTRTVEEVIEPIEGARPADGRPIDGPPAVPPAVPPALPGPLTTDPAEDA